MWGTGINWKETTTRETPGPLSMSPESFWILLQVSDSGRIEKMEEYNEECLLTFLKNQGRLFDEPVAENLAEAEAFLEDCMAVVVSSIEEVREYFQENGADVEGMSDEELEEASEVFSLPDGSYLIVEG